MRLERILEVLQAKGFKVEIRHGHLTHIVAAAEGDELVVQLRPKRRRRRKKS